MYLFTDGSVPVSMISIKADCPHGFQGSQGQRQLTNIARYTKMKIFIASGWQIF